SAPDGGISPSPPPGEYGQLTHARRCLLWKTKEKRRAVRFREKFARGVRRPKRYRRVGWCLALESRRNPQKPDSCAATPLKRNWIRFSRSRPAQYSESRRERSRPSLWPLLRQTHPHRPPLPSRPQNTSDFRDAARLPIRYCPAISTQEGASATTGRAPKDRRATPP